MAIVLLILVCALSVAAQQQAAAATVVVDPSKLARLEGRVVGLDGEPVKKASLHLVMIPPESRKGIVNYRGTADNEGNFVFEDINPAEYFLDAQRNDYIRTRYDSGGQGNLGTRIRLGEGQVRKGILVKMPRAALIAGKVLDEDGEPLGGAWVHLHRYVWAETRQILQVVGQATAHQDGSYTVGNLPPGRYYVSGAAEPFPPWEGEERPARRGVQEEYVTSYYPNATEVNGAAAIQLTHGAAVRGVDMRIRRARVFRIAGKAVAAANQMAPRTTITLMRPGDSSFDFMNRNRTTLREDGGFEFRHLVAGSYLIATTIDGPVRPDALHGRVLVEIANEDVNNVLLQLRPPATLRGTVVVEDPSDVTKTLPLPSLSPQPVFQLLPTEGLAQGERVGRVAEDGSFIVERIPPDRFRMALSGIPAGHYVRSIQLANEDVTHSLLDFTGGLSGEIQIVLSPKAAEIHGTVRNEKGDPASNAIMSVWEPGVPFSLSPGVRRLFRADANGNFKFGQLAPGNYRVLAWERINAQDSSDPALLKAFESQAVTVKLQDGSIESLDLKLIPADAVEVELAKIR